MTRAHELKCEPQLLEDIRTLRKRFELRLNDRDFQVGDSLLLRGWEEGGYTGKWVWASVDFILSNYPGLQPGYVIMSINAVAVGKQDSWQGHPIVTDSIIPAPPKGQW